MIKSMTGFGKGEAVGDLGRFTVEIRTVNHRYFDLSSRIPNNLGQMEDRIKNYLHSYIKRGKVNLSLSHKKSGKNFNSVKIDEEAAKKYYKILKKIKADLKLTDDIQISHVLSFPDVIVQDQPDYDIASLWPVIERAVKKAVFECNAMREAEGKAIYNDLKERIASIEESMDKIAKTSPSLAADYKKKLDQRIKDILKQPGYSIDKVRLETEVAIFAKQCDISEELTRAKSHTAVFGKALLSNKETGRRLDFILQELQREINTLGAKAGSEKISKLVIDIKSEIEKIREQVQNVE
jgi:uncharacterized protein (TIGR00255 family)